MPSTGPVTRPANAIVPTLLVAGTLLGAAGSLVYYEDAAPTTMNPLFARTMADHRTHELVFDRLFFRTPIDSELRSRIVDRFERLDGGRALKLMVVPGIKWHDGHELSAADLCFTIDAILDPRTSVTLDADYRKALAGCDVVGGAAVVRFRKIYHEPREHLGFAVLPKHAFTSTAVSPDLPFSRRPIGTGPMRAERGRLDVHFQAFPNVHHQPKIAEMWQGNPEVDDQVQVSRVLSGAAQGIVSVPTALRPQISVSDDVALKSYDLRAWWFVAINTHRGALADVNVRQALDASLDRGALCSFIAGSDPDDPNPPCEPISGPFVQSSPYYNRTTQVRRRDLAAVGASMRAANATDDGGHWSWRGAPIRLKIGMSRGLDREAKDLLDQVHNALDEAGFASDIVSLSPEDWATRAVPGRLQDFDLLVGKWSYALVEDVNDLFQTRTATTGQRNLFDYTHPEVDRLLSAYDRAPTDTEARDAYRALHALVAKDLPYLFLWKLQTKSAWRRSVTRNSVTPYHYFTTLDEWTWDGSDG